MFTWIKKLHCKAIIASRAYYTAVLVLLVLYATAAVLLYSLTLPLVAPLLVLRGDLREWLTDVASEWSGFRPGIRAALTYERWIDTASVAFAALVKHEGRAE